MIARVKIPRVHWPYRASKGNGERRSDDARFELIDLTFMVSLPALPGMRPSLYSDKRIAEIRAAWKEKPE